MSTLYYIAGYIAFKHNIGLDAPTENIEAFVFTTNVSRGLPKHPTDDFFQLASSLYFFYKQVMREQIT